MRIRLLALPVTLGPTVVAGSKAAAGATVVSVFTPTYGGLLSMAPSSRPSAPHQLSNIDGFHSSFVWQTGLSPTLMVFDVSTSSAVQVGPG